MNTPVHDFLLQYAAKQPLRFHMPGHIGAENPLDITEICGADDLYVADGIIGESESNASALFGSEQTLYSCGGSTQSIEAMIGLAKKLAPKEKNHILAGRYSHSSLLYAAISCGLEVDWAYPKEYISCDISPDEIERRITEKTMAVFINSIDYYGGMSDIPAISLVCKKHDLPLLVDNAHGAYLVFTDNHPIKNGATMCADSAHKTLPCLTGASYLHIADEKYIPYAKKMMKFFGSSSPSYLITDSLDRCNRFISDNADSAQKTMRNIQKLKDELVANGIALRHGEDMRITIDAAKLGYSGYELEDLLKSNNIFCELSDSRYVVLLMSVTTPESWLKAVLTSLCGAEKRTPLNIETRKAIPAGKRNMSAQEAFFSHSEFVALSECEGRICTEIVSPSPPCVPLALPGEELSREVVEIMREYGVEKIGVVS